MPGKAGSPAPTLAVVGRITTAQAAGVAAAETARLAAAVEAIVRAVLAPVVAVRDRVAHAPVVAVRAPAAVHALAVVVADRDPKDKAAADPVDRAPRARLCQKNPARSRRLNCQTTSPCAIWQR